MLDQVAGSSLMVLISGAWVRMTAPVDRIRFTRGPEQLGLELARVGEVRHQGQGLAAAATSSNRRRVSSASGSVTNRCGQ